MASLAAVVAVVVGAAVPWALSAGANGPSVKSARLAAMAPLADDVFAARLAGIPSSSAKTGIAVAGKADRARSAAGTAGAAFALLPPIAPAPLTRPVVGTADPVATAAIEPSPERLAYAATPADAIPLPQRRPDIANTVREAVKPAPVVASAVPETATKPRRDDKQASSAAQAIAAAAPGDDGRKPAEPRAKAKAPKAEFALASLGGDKPKRTKASLLGYAPTDTPASGNLANSVEGFFNRPSAVSASGKRVAIYDISAAKVYMPNGQTLEAHSGMGDMKDNPRYVAHKMKGPTPPDVYKLSMREKRFHGVAAIRMTPVDGRAKHGRTGFLAHTALVRGTNGSHGCVAFRDYQTFLTAFKKGKITHMVVVNNKSEARKYLASL